MAHQFDNPNAHHQRNHAAETQKTR